MAMKRASSYFWRVVTVSAFILSSWPVAAQEADTPPKEQTSIHGGKAHSGKTHSGSTKSAKKTTRARAKAKTAKTADMKPKAGQFASEAEAKAKCRGTVIWVDQDHLNHYKGAREYGVKPGVFACE
jgi:hypothetical protein